MDGTILLPYAYFPPVHWFALLSTYDKGLLNGAQSYRKQRLFSRTHIKTPQGIQALVITVQRRDSKADIASKLVSYAQNWPQNHWRSIYFAYKNSPYFDFYADELEDYFHQKFDSLSSLTLRSIQLSLKWLQLDRSLMATDETDLSLDYSTAFSPSTQHLPPWFNILPYQQVFEPFSPGLSILDLIFNLGPESVALLRKSVQIEKL